ncbi:MAG: indolepyruvate oxidoreductase subunit beta [Oscillospiraceae bacterium]|nr:indolepyruvate oxidoreductase subunit beta [Oscillospiraceae bacterium]
MKTDIMIVGVGGQGTLLTSRILGKLALKAGLDVKLSEVHGMAQRGGSVVTFVRFGESVGEPIVEESGADILIAFEKLEALRYAHFLKPGGTAVVNNTEIPPITVVTGADVYPSDIIERITAKYKTELVNATEKAKAIGSPKSFNVLVLGAAAKHTPFAKELWLEVIKETVPPKTIEVNTKAFLIGYGEGE